MSVPIQTFLDELVTALQTTGVSVQLRRQMVMDKVRSSATKHIIVVPFNDPVTKPESPASYIVTCSATVRLCVVDNSDANAITALTSLWSEVRQATYAKAWSGRRYIPPVADSEFTPDPEQSNFYYMDAVFSAEYQESLVPITVPDCAALTESAANLAITAAGLTPDSDGAFSATVEKGLVINQSPAAGTAVYAGDIVTITVSFGTEYTIVPVTAGLTAAAAEAALVAAGLVLGTSTSSMTDDTAAGLVASSSPAAGTGVAAGSAVDIVVSLGDRRYEIPVYIGLGLLSTASFLPITKFDWIWPDGTVQNGATCTYRPPQGGGLATCIVKMKDGFTVADLTAVYVGSSETTLIRTEDLIYCRPTTSFTGAGGAIGDIYHIRNCVGNATSKLQIRGEFRVNLLYGSLDDWVPIQADQVLIWYGYAYSGSLKFVANAPTTQVNVNTTSSFSYAQIAQTIINWDACNAASFARTGYFNYYKRSLIGAANPAAEAAIVSLELKGCSFTFLAE